MSPLATCFRHRSTLLLLVVWPVVLWTLSPRSPEPWELGLGIALAAAGAGLRLASVRCLGKSARVHRAGVRGELICWGPYAWSRNPLYVAAALLITGLGLVAGGGPWGLLLFVGVIAVYTPTVIHEERTIRASHWAEYEDYLKTVPRWLGIPRGPRQRRDERVPWSQVLRREAGLVPGTALGVGGILLVRAQVIPLGRLVDWLVETTGLPLQALLPLGFLLGAVVNSIGIERKRRRHEARRAALAAAEAQQQSESEPLEQPAES